MDGRTPAPVGRSPLKRGLEGGAWLWFVVGLIAVRIQDETCCSSLVGLVLKRSPSLTSDSGRCFVSVAGPNSVRGCTRHCMLQGNRHLWAFFFFF